MWDCSCNAVWLNDFINSTAAFKYAQYIRNKTKEKYLLIGQYKPTFAAVARLYHLILLHMYKAG